MLFFKPISPIFYENDCMGKLEIHEALRCQEYDQIFFCLQKKKCLHYLVLNILV